ncbi:MAG: TonB-dependent receptor, partial [Rhodoferax sp.]
RNTVGDALNLLPGVTLSNNSRNEKTIYVRGFDARQVPLFIDGIPLYVPYDGYVDFNRFSTSDLAGIQVAKGFSSVLYGPNALGGAINLISRKPKARLEGDATLGYGSGNERQTAVNVGSNQGNWYVQASASYAQADSFPLSTDFKPTSTEDGGQRENAYRKDSKGSVKVGLTPNASDEYALSYHSQNGVKGQPPSTDPTAARFWQWPYWNTSGVNFISKTLIGSSETLKARLYRDTYTNETDTFTNASYTTLKTSGSGSVSTGRSLYDDAVTGISIELESLRWNAHSVRLVTHYKEDEHKESDATGVTNASYKDALISYGAEDSIVLNPDLTLALGMAQHMLRPASVYNNSSSYGLPDTKTATNGQAGVYYDYTADTRLYATLAQKSHLPTLKDRYSQRLGSYIENPNLATERSINYEVGYQGTPWHGAKAQAALFYSDTYNKIQSAFVGAIGSSCNASAKCQMQNVGTVRTSGLELSLNAPLRRQLEAGASYTYLNLENVSNPTVRITDIPRQKLTAQLLYKATDVLDLVAFVEYNSSRWSSNVVELPDVTTLNFTASYQATKYITADLGVTNLADKNYQLADGFPNPGRMWFAKLRTQF